MSARLIYGAAECLEVGCHWHTDGKNAMGNAAQHAKRTGHLVHVELEYSVRASK